jgi:hypothetical protein
MTATLLLLSSVLGQYPYYPPAGYAPGYGYPYYGRTPLQTYDPMRYNRYYSGEGFYTYNPPAIENPEVINFRQPAPAPTPAPPTITGVVLAVDEPHKQLKVQLPTTVTTIAYGPSTHFLAADGNFPVIKPGNLIKVEQNTITILRRSQQ